MFRKSNKIRFSKGVLYDFRYNKALIVMLILPMALLIIFNYVPLYGLQIAFKDYKPLQNMWEAEWVGFKYFEKFINYYGFEELLKNTILLNTYDLIIAPVPLIFALCINYFPNKKIKNLIQTVAITPHFISLVVVCSLVLRFLSVDGVINDIIELFGGERINFLTHGSLFRSIYVWSGAWQNTGFSAIVYVSTLAEVSKSQHEAASMDGANILQKIRYIDLPNVLPMFAVNLVFRCGAMLSNNYEKILLLQNNFNLEYSQVISTYTYEIAFKGIVPQYSLSTAIGIMTAIVNLIMLLIIKKVTKNWEKIDE